MSERVLDFLGRTDVWALVAALSGFLSLTWLIRQAPLGQPGPPEPSEAPAAPQRDRAVIVAVIGFLAILLGGYLAVEVGVPASIPAFAVGIALVQWVLRTYRKARHDSPTIRRLVAFSETSLTASMITGVLLVGNVLAFRLGGRPIDLTHDKAYSLASQSLNQVLDLDRPLKFTVFFGNSERSMRQLDRVRQLVELYHVANPSKVSVEYLDPFRDIKEFEALARRVPDVAASSGDGMVLTLGEGADAPRAVLGTRELFDVGSTSGSSSDRYTSTFRGEDLITSTLIRLREGKRTKVAFSTGHGEPSTAEVDFNRAGFGLWRARLASVGSDVIEINLLRDQIPTDVTLLVIGGPKVAFQDQEIKQVKQYLARGGPMIVLADAGEAANIGDLLPIYNVDLGPGVITDPKYHFENRSTIVYAPLAPNVIHPIVAPMVEQVALLQNASPINILGLGTLAGSSANTTGSKPPPPPNPGILTTPILRTSPGSWAESDPETRPMRLDRGREAAGSLVVGVAATTRPALASEQPTPRLVLFSSSSLADNRLLRTEATNIDLLMNAVSWLRNKPELIGIAPKTHEALLFAADPGLQLRLVMVPTLVAGVVIVGLGLATYLARRD